MSDSPTAPDARPDIPVVSLNERREGEVWHALQADAERCLAHEPQLAPLLNALIVRQPDFASGLSALLGRKLRSELTVAEALQDVVLQAMAADPAIRRSALADLLAVRERDPATRGFLTPFLHFKGFHALQWQRVANWLWRRGRSDFALFLQSRMSEVLAVDIHPAVPIGDGVLLDHGTGIVVGETATIGNNVSILQSVTLGGTGKERGDRHPKIHDGVLLSAGAIVLGNIVVGRGAKVGAGSVVLKDVPPCATVAGIPAKIVGWCEEGPPALSMDHSL
jgi:serine O-acetyltransferase